jgi:hypothetical protein
MPNKLRATNPLYLHKRKAKLTIREIADALGYRSVDSVFRLMRYEMRPSIKVAANIAKLLNRDIGDVVRDYYSNVWRPR